MKTCRCPYCDRILHPQKDGTLPAHRRPRTSKYGRTSQQLTGRGNQWCPGGEDRRENW